MIIIDSVFVFMIIVKCLIPLKCYNAITIVENVAVFPVKAIVRHVACLFSVVSSSCQCLSIDVSQ